MRPIQHILEGILDDEYDIDIVDNNPLITILKKARPADFDPDLLCLDRRDCIELMRLPIDHDLAQCSFEHIDPPLTNYIKVVQQGKVIACWDDRRNSFYIYWNKRKYQVDKSENFEPTGLHISSMMGQIRLSGISVQNNHFKTFVYSIPDALFIKVLDVLKIPYRIKK